MRNLIVNQRKCENFYDLFKSEKINEELLKRVQYAINLSCYDLYILMGDSLYVLPAEAEAITSIHIGEYSSSEIIAMEYCITLQELYCAYDSGEIATIDMTDPDCVDYNVVTTFEDGLQCMKFSPDHELITVVTGKGNVNTMVLDGQVMSAEYLYSEDFGRNQLITAGWGKKETQFHGSVGKAAAQAKPEQLVPNKNDDGRTRIAWREDGTLFAVNFLHRETKIRKFKIFSREGILFWTNKQVSGLEEYISWRPLSNWITVALISNNNYFISFFEKNGLQYSKLLLPFTPQEMKVKDLLWSPCSDILAVVCYNSKTSTTLIQLWIDNNCHWYLKQTITFPKKNPLLYVTWSDAINHKKELFCITTSELTFYSFNWGVNHSRDKTVADKAVVGVIDGNRILVTSFREAVIPPPLAHQSIETIEPQNAILFAPSVNDKSSSISSNEFCTVSCTNKLTFFKLIKEFSILAYEVKNSRSINLGLLDNTEYEYLGIKNSHYYMHHFLWFTEDIILFSITTKEHNLLCILSLDKIDSQGRLPIQKIHVLDYPIECIISSPDASTAYIKAKKQIYKYTQDGQFEKTDITFNKVCIQMDVIKMHSKGRDLILALSAEHKFLVDGEEFIKNITGFYVHSDFLLLTTLQETLICVPLSDIVSSLKQSPIKFNFKPWLNRSEVMCKDIYIRRLEKDARIIVAISGDSRTILQMPRGNLECIQPRALLLQILKRYFDNCNYVTALGIMTKQRINLNLLYDHNPQLFKDNVEKFVEDTVQHKKVNWLCLFLTELKNEDVISTIYASCYANRVKSKTENNKTVVNKIDEVCKLLRDVMEKHPIADTLIQPILISLVKNQQRQGLENALDRIKQIKMLESPKLAQRGSSVSAHEALKYLLHFVNIDTLYDIALGMYDLELAKFIASKSSKDPKEYIPFLNNLKKLDQNYMKYTINEHLKRYESALEFISKDSTRFEKCLDLIRSQKLYDKALKLFEKNTEQHKKIAEIYGEFLLNEGNYRMAGTMFYRSGDLNKALKSFNMSNNNWEDVIAISKELKLSPIDLHELYKELVENLKAERKYEPAAIILKDYLNDVEEAIALLCEGRMWKHAIRITLDVQRLDLNETHIKPGVKKHAEHVISQLSTTKEEFLKYKSRLAVLRKEMTEKQTKSINGEIYNDEPETNKEIPDSISDTSSIADSTLSQTSRTSISSGKSYRSSKNRRKQARKLFSLKEGSRFEDLSLIYTLYQIISNAYGNGDEWYQLVQVLYRFEFDESAERIIIKGNEFLQLVESSKPEIWNKLALTSLHTLEQSAKDMTQAQLQEIITPIKQMERYIVFPPEIEPPLLPIDHF